MKQDISTTHKWSFILYAVSFVLFGVNLWHELVGEPLNLNNEAGAYILASFFALGLVLQIAKIVEGHRSRLAIVMTLLLLVIHVGAEVVIWTRTRIAGMGLPADLPYWVVGGYWIMGVVDIVSMYAAREYQLLTGDRMTVEEQLRQQITDQRQEISGLRDTITELQSEKAQVEKDMALVEQRLTMVENSKTTVEERATALQNRLEEVEREKNKTYTAVCDQCDWTQNGYTSSRSRDRGLASHVGRVHNNG